MDKIGTVEKNKKLEKNKKIIYFRFCAAAACLALVIFAASKLPTINSSNTGNSSLSAAAPAPQAPPPEMYSKSTSGQEEADLDEESALDEYHLTVGETSGDMAKYSESREPEIFGEGGNLKNNHLALTTEETNVFLQGVGFADGARNSVALPEIEPDYVLYGDPAVKPDMIVYVWRTEEPFLTIVSVNGEDIIYSGDVELIIAEIESSLSAEP